MGLTSEGISNVRVKMLPAGIWADGDSIASHGVALVRWESNLNDKFYQVYVNGRFAGETTESNQRQMIVPVGSSFETAVQIRVYAVEAVDAHKDFSEQVSWLQGQSGQVRVIFVRAQSLPVGATVWIYSDGGSGQINYGEPINKFPLHVWPSWQDKAGFGMSEFSMGDFGFDSSAAVGFGKGSFGGGEFGLDADTFEWVSDFLSRGVYKFGAKIFNEAGCEIGSCEAEPIIVCPAANPAEMLSIMSFNKQIN